MTAQTTPRLDADPATDAAAPDVPTKASEGVASQGVASQGVALEGGSAATSAAAASIAPPAFARARQLLETATGTKAAGTTRATRAPNPAAPGVPARRAAAPGAARPMPRPALPRLFGTVAMAAGCLLLLKGIEIANGGGLVETARAQSLLGDTPPVIEIDRARGDDTAIYIETAGRETPGATPTNPLDRPSTEEVLGERIAERRRLLSEREREMEMRETLLKAAEARLEERIGSLKTLGAKAEEAAQSGPAANADMDRVVTMYEAMKAKEAARIFGALDMDVLEDVARRMNPRKLADIMAEMDAKPATRLTVRLAGARTARAPVAESATLPLNLPRIQGERPRD